MSSFSDKPYKAKWLNRAKKKEDPWVSVQDYSKCMKEGCMVYGENSSMNIIKAKNEHGGADVWIKKGKGLDSDADDDEPKDDDDKKKDPFASSVLFPDLKGWMHVRHVPGVDGWHPANDNLEGT